MKKQFIPFEAMVPYNFTSLMIAYWIGNEDLTRREVKAAYYDDDFKALAKRLSNTKCLFIPDLGYTDNNINGTLCFENEDNNIVIPIAILRII